eukprot:3592605-Amphidinium_carterae.1
MGLILYMCIVGSIWSTILPSFAGHCVGNQVYLEGAEGTRCLFLIMDLICLYTQARTWMEYKHVCNWHVKF